MGSCLSLGLLLTGCYTISYKGDRAGAGAEKSEWNNYFLWGLVGEANVDLQQVCPGGVSSWKSQQTFVQGLIGIVTLGIYIPRSVIAQCAGGSAVELQLDPWDGHRFATLEGQPAQAGR